MKRGGYGKPWRPPADGWSVPPKIFFGGLYQHLRPALNNLPRFTNNTQVPLQLNEVGPPQTRINPAALVANCNVTDTTGLPRLPWIGVATNQYLPPRLGGLLTNAFFQNGTNDLGKAARLRGFKNVQAVRQWHGCFGWLSQDSPVACDNAYCLLRTNGDCTYDYNHYQTEQLVPDQVKYLRCDWTVNYSLAGNDDSLNVFSTASSGSGYVSVDKKSGLLTNALTTSETDVNQAIAGSLAPIKNITNGYDSVINAHMQPTFADGIIAGDYHCGTPNDIQEQINTWNTGACTFGFPGSVLPPITDINNYSASATYTLLSGEEFDIHIEWHRTATLFTWNYSANNNGGSAGVHNSHTSFTGSCQLSQPNPASDIYADKDLLLSYWDLSDDAMYPWRTDGIWQVAPLVSRDEFPANRTPLGFYTAELQDPRTGNSFVPWYDVFGFDLPPGGGGIQQFALTGSVCGMPMPRAFTDPDSFWYGGSGTPMPPAGSVFENFFDFRANLWRACTYTVLTSKYEDFYAYGYGEWLYDAIGRTGAQLPHCATQWTNNLQAFNKPPYAYCIQSDKQIYDTPYPPDTVNHFFAAQADALWAQKCCEIVELWPSQNFARPAGLDRFNPDETACYCISIVSGQQIICNSTPTAISAGDYVGIDSLGFSGIYSVTSRGIGNDFNISNTPVYPFPTGFSIPSNDFGASEPCVYKVRFKNAPAILGRDAIASLTASGGNTIITLNNPGEPNLMTGDTIDICTTNITYDAKGNRVSEAMTVLQSNIAVNRTDDTHFTVGLAISLLTGATHIVSHGAANWYWDDNGRKGDFVTLQWLYDYRTNGEIARLSGVTACGFSPPTGSNTGFKAPTPLPATGTPGNSLGWTSDQFQAQGAIMFRPCCYSVIAITPNREVWNNAVVIPFPATFTFDDLYGARWQAEIEQAMGDLLWQAPHLPCDFPLGNTWNMDDGTCKCQTPCFNGAGDDIYYAHFPWVEARINLPGNGGNSQNETAPALPAGITLGYINPVGTLTNALLPPGQIGYDTTTGNPSGAFTFWGYRLAIEDNACFGTCQFNYVDMENLPCVVSFTPGVPSPIVDPGVTTGNTGDQTLT